MAPRFQDLEPLPEPAAPIARRRRDPLFTLLFANAVWGAGLGVLFVVAAIALDVGHLRTLIGLNADGLVALVLLSGGSIVTFASVAMGGAIMLIDREEEGSGGKRREAITDFAGARVSVAARRAR